MTQRMILIAVHLMFVSVLFAFVPHLLVAGDPDVAAAAERIQPMIVTSEASSRRGNLLLLRQQQQSRQTQAQEQVDNEGAQEEDLDAPLDENPELQEQQQLSVTFSLWHPEMSLLMNSAMTEQEENEGFQQLLDMIQTPVLDALRLFFCQDTGLIVVDDNYKSVCPRNRKTMVRRVQSSSAAAASVSDFLKQQDPDNSYIADSATNLVVAPYATFTPDNDEGDSAKIQYWWTWQVNYRLEQIGAQLIDQANMMNVSDHLGYMEDVTQLALDVSIMEGSMDARMDGTNILMSMIGLEDEMFQEAAERYTSNGGDGSSGNDEAVGAENGSSNLQNGNGSFSNTEFEMGAEVLRYIGIGMLVVNVIVVTLLTTLARRRRRRRMEEQVTQKADGAARLVTEQGVNKMLEIGRAKSEEFGMRASSGLSTGKAQF